MSHKKINIYVNAVQILFGLSVFLMFCVAFFLLAGKNVGSMGPIVAMTAKSAILPVIIYLLNYCLLVPKLFFRERKLWFFTADIAVVMLAAFLPFIFMQKPQVDEVEQLSDLLRYALYESNNHKVKVVDEMEFMGNYISLMSLRCSDKTMVEVHFDEFDPTLKISPLLFISLVENAFKHGTSAHHDAIVKIDMGMDGADLVFSCENSLVPKETKDYSGSGVGLENLKRRLELLYPGSYVYKAFVERGRYVAMVRIKNVDSHDQDEMCYSG